jgi:PAS domain S-box-containing protein
VQFAVAHVLATGDQRDAIAQAIQEVCRGFGWFGGAAWTVNQASDALRCSAIWHDAVDAGVATRLAELVSFAPGAGLAGRVWQSGHAALADDPARDATIWVALGLDPRRHAHAVAFPMHSGDETIGAIEFLVPPDTCLDDALQRVIAAISGQFGAFLRRQQAERETHRSDRRFAQVFRASPTPTSISRLDDGTLVDVNDSFLALLGYSRQELIGRSALDLGLWVEPRDRDALIGRLQHETIRNVETTLRTRSGTMRQVLVSMELMESDGVPYVLALLDDVSEQRAAIEQSAFQAHLLDEVGQAIVATDIDGQVVYWNRFAETLFGWSTLEMLGRNSLEAIQVDLTSDLRREIGRALTGGHWSGELLLRRRDGSQFQASITTSPVRAAGGGLAAVVAVIEDVSDQRRAEAALRESEARFRALSDNASDVIIIDEPPVGIRYISASVERVSGYRPADVIGHSLLEFIHPDDAAAVRDLTAGLRTGSGRLAHVELRVRHADGSWRTVEAVVTNLLDDPAIRGYVVTYSDISERTRAENALRESEARFRALSDNSSDVLTIAAADGTVRYTSNPVLRVIGMRPDEVAGRNFCDFLHPDDAERIRGLFAEIATRPGAYAATEFRTRHTDGSWRIIGAVANNLLDDPSLRGIIVNWRDITRRKRAEEAPREAEARYRGIIENALEGIFQAGPDGRFLAANPAAARMLGFSSPEALMASVNGIRDLFIDAEREAEFTALLSSQDAVADFEFRARRDGGEVWIALNARIVRDHAGNVTSIEGILADISQRKRAEEALAASARQNLAQKTELEEILTHLGDGLMLADTQRRVTLINPAGRAILGLAPGEDGEPQLEASYWHAVMPDDAVVPDDQLPLARALAGERGPAQEMQIVINGEPRLISISAAPLTTPEGAAHGAVAVLRDVTETRRSQDRVAQTERLRALGEMASGVAHDFNNLIAVILGRCELLLGPAFGIEERLASHLEVIKRAALDGAETVKRLQAFSGVSSPAAGEAMDLVAIVRDIVEFTRARWKDAAQQRGVTIEVETEVEPVPPLSGSPAELREVLVNLVFNAVDAMPEGGTIRITVQRHDDEVWLQVRDTGTGMPEAVRRRIFEPFFTTKGTRGAGLGLSMSYAIVTRLGGRLEVESAPGAGTTFTIALPFQPAEPQTIEGETAGMPALSILLVDDQPQMLETAALMLELEGHLVVMAESGAEALARIRQLKESGEAFDVVLTDLGMPGMNGLQLIQAIRAEDVETPCVLVTGWGTKLAADDVEAAGAQALLPKPFSSAQLHAVLAEVVRSYAVAPEADAQL